jgi:CheY-like chemotaxis protein
MKRILLIDDNEAFRRPMGEILQRAGYEVESAPEGRAALNLYRRQAFDLVITDLIMPGMEGVETILALRQLAPALKIIAVSGGGRLDAQDYLPIAEHLGANKTLAKPFSAHALLDTVSCLLS